MPSPAFLAFVEKITNDEVFRDEVIANPKDILATWDFNQEELDDIKRAPAWTWLREMWQAPPGWESAR